MKVKNTIALPGASASLVETRAGVQDKRTALEPVFPRPCVPPGARFRASDSSIAELDELERGIEFPREEARTQAHGAAWHTNRTDYTYPIEHADLRLGPNPANLKLSAGTDFNGTGNAGAWRRTILLRCHVCVISDSASYDLELRFA